MANIAFFTLPEAGHLNPCFELARSLQKVDPVCFFGPPQSEDYITRRGFAFKKVAASLYPGHCAIGDSEFSRVTDSGGDQDSRSSTSLAPLGVITEGEAKQTIQQLLDFGPDLLMIDPWCLGILDYYLMNFGTRIPVILLNTSLVMPFVATDHIGAMVSKMGIRTLFLCPREFDYPRADLNNLEHSYLGLSIDLQPRESEFDWTRISDRKLLIYCSFGSQGHRYTGARDLLQRIILALSCDWSLQAVIAVGKNFEPASFHGVGSEVTVVNYAPQQEMLKRATLMITHGGLGSIKECIYFGVPMIVYPFDTDQPANAARVAFHGLGLKGDTHHASVEQILNCVKKVQNDPSYRSRVSDLSQKLRTSDPTSIAVELVNEVLNRKGAHRAMS